MNTSLLIPEEAQWIDFIETEYYSCDLSNCSDCTRRMYPKRQRYVSSWMKVYVTNRTAIKEGTSKMNLLIWKNADTAKWFNLGSFHKDKCNNNQSMALCTCETALLFKALYGSDIYENYEAASLDMIYPLFLKTVKNYK